mmetsp:Transcript_37630/g.105725  ORF Transcript_37630/g.105725 Transcript_37630/m.105725 type:complete len:206 (+) Transcript_37630:73-690(+)
MGTLVPTSTPRLERLWKGQILGFKDLMVFLPDAATPAPLARRLLARPPVAVHCRHRDTALGAGVAAELLLVDRAALAEAEPGIHLGGVLMIGAQGLDVQPTQARKLRIVQVEVGQLEQHVQTHQHALPGLVHDVRARVAAVRASVTENGQLVVAQRDAQRELVLAPLVVDTDLVGIVGRSFHPCPADVACDLLIALLAVGFQQWC